MITFFACLILLMTFTLFVEYRHLYEQHKEYVRDRHDDIKNKIQRLVNEKPSIITSFKVFQQVFCGKNILLSEKESLFEYNSWIDVTDHVDIDSKIDSSVALLIKFKVEFADLETEKSYKEHVEEFSNQVLESHGDDVNITTTTTIKLGSVTKEKCIEIDEDFLFYVQRLHWLLKIFIWFKKKFDVKTVIIKKNVSIQLEEIL